MNTLAYLPARGVVELAGADRIGFLQGLVSNDVTTVAPGRAVWAAMLTPQGKYLADFFILANAERLLLDCAASQAADLAARLARFRLRARISLRDASADWAVHAAWGDAEPPADSLAARDPRLPEAGWRILAAAPLAPDGSAAYARHRLALGLPDAVDMEPDRTVLLEAGFDELGGVSWTKGCYMGQELTARTKYRGLIKRRLIPVDIAGPPPAPGSPILSAGTEVGTMRSHAGDRGLATLRLDALAGPLASDQATLTARPPAWMRLAD